MERDRDQGFRGNAGLLDIKIAAMTVGETGGDSVIMTLNLGYLTGTAIFLSALVVLVILQIAAKRFHPFLYWATIVRALNETTEVCELD